jgi:Restriction endonuclease PvuII
LLWVYPSPSYLATMTTTNPDYQEYLRLFPAIQEYQALAKKYNIADIFQDNGGKYVQLLILLGLKTSGKREGNDAFDENGVEFEIKTVNVELTKSFSTHHHMNPVIIKKYRVVDWYFAVYKSIELQCIYKMTPQAMEPYYQAWEAKWNADGGKDINNPKVPLKYVLEHGSVVWMHDGSDKYEIPKIPKRTKANQIDLLDL